MCHGFLGVHQGPIPGHWRHSSGVNHWTIRNYWRLRHWTSFSKLNGRANTKSGRLCSNEHLALAGCERHGTGDRRGLMALFQM